MCPSNASSGASKRPFSFTVTDDVKRELAAVYAELAEEQSRLSAECHQCGACCQFETYGHQLWVTNLELAVLLDVEGLREATRTGKCPYMRKNQCTAREGRTLGCRVFLCEQDASKMEAIHEKYFGKIQELAQKHSIELEYDEFLSFLKRVEDERGD